MARMKPEHSFRVDADGNPTGGFSVGQGYSITWQNGVGDDAGAHIDEVIDALIERLMFFQGSKFACPENGETLAYLRAAKISQEERTKRRKLRGVEGTYQV
jgi:hypothetical protein